MIPDEDFAVELLKKYAPDERSFEIVYRHSRNVAQIALKLAELAFPVDRHIILIGSLLHDIGRFIYPPPSIENAARHGIGGADILRNEGVDERLAMICENHIGVGITKKDIILQKMPLPLRDLVPTTKEEKIIAYADNIEKFISSDLDITQESLKNSEFLVEERFGRELGFAYKERTRDFHAEIRKLLDFSR